MLEALGAQWPLNRKSKPDYAKEMKRLDECHARLNRARLLPMSLARLAQVISVGCLSLLDYVNLPDVKPYTKLRAMVKDAMGLKSSAPEVVVSLLQPGTLDPMVRWLLAGLKLWFHVLKCRPDKADVDEIIESGKARLGKTAIEAFRWGISVLERGFQVGPTFVSANGLLSARPFLDM